MIESKIQMQGTTLRNPFWHKQNCS